MLKKIMVSLLFLLMIGILIACNESETSTSEGGSENNTDGEVLEIGLVGPLSGGAAGWGLPLQYGVEMAIKEVNENGGLEIGGTTYNVELIAYDDQYIGDEAVSAANRLVFEDGVEYIFGTIGSSGVLGMQTITEDNEVLLIPNSYGSKTVSPEKPFTFRAFQTNLEWGFELGSYISEEFPDAKKVAFISPNDESGWEVQKNAEEDLVELGFEVVANEFPERDTQDYNPVLTKVLNTEPDIIAFGGTSPGEMGVAMNQARALGYDGLFTTFAGPAIQEILSIAGDNAEDFIYYAQIDLQAPEVQELFNKYGQEYEEEFLETAPDWYDVVKMLFAAMEETGSLDTTEVAETLRNMEGFEGIAGELSWTGEENYGINQQLIKPVIVGQIIDGEGVIVDVREIKE
ncbi:ABC transporter substrate-binding protein [Oceanobacillus salinisoli]|uniref:ABC transporter substrate-binding protein n=1 Tax=Oceanobacillus salinisoli TaxID=2678611 RepID=UPI0012E20D81|nr:ABC transporter substrate-binding protein [Oceanobacillus salinisoli]